MAYHFTSDQRLVSDNMDDSLGHAAHPVNDNIDPGEIRLNSDLCVSKNDRLSVFEEETEQEHTKTRAPKAVINNPKYSDGARLDDPYEDVWQLIKENQISAPAVKYIRIRIKESKYINFEKEQSQIENNLMAWHVDSCEISKVLLILKVCNRILKENHKVYCGDNLLEKMQKFVITRSDLSAITDIQENRVLTAVCNIVERYHLSELASAFVWYRARKMRPVDVARERMQEVIDYIGLSSESSDIISLFRFYNAFIEETRFGRFASLARYDDLFESEGGLYETAKDMSSVLNYVRKGNLPVYGYARDRFGRVQERDSYREDKKINPYSTRSDYDSEDDHESMDILD